MAKPIIAVTGKNGQLGSELQQLVNELPAFDFVFTDREDMDLTDAAALEQFFKQHQPTYFIHGGAYTAVDKAETEKDIAFAINATATGVIAAQCKLYNTVLIYISTDYVFNGGSHLPYEPDDKPDPINHYGYTKLAGEQLAMENNLHTMVIRTSWVYSTYGHNFVKTMLRLMKERTDINVVSDQFGSPTYAADLAKAIINVIKYCTIHPPVRGIYHFSNEGNISWYEFAVTIQQMAHLQCNVHPITTDQYPTPTPRPVYSVMNKERIKSVFGVEIRNWQDSLKECIGKLLQTA
jgi:dTDP-4-dehydrorhamnose reductase